MRSEIVTALLASTIMCGARANAQTTQQSNPRLRVAMVSFVNQTNDASLDAVATRIDEAAATLAGQLPRAVLVRATSGGVRATDAPSAIGARTQASIVIRGTISRSGDQIELAASALNAADGSTIHQFPMERAAASDPSSAIQSMANRIAGMLALHTDARRSRPQLYSVPTLAAYELEKQADSLFHVGRPAQALPLVYRAVQLDSMYAAPLFLAAAIHRNAGRAAVGDSLLEVLETRKNRLTEIERFSLAWFRETPVKAYQAATAALAMDPGSDNWTYGVGLRANEAGYYREAVAALSQRAELAAKGSQSARIWAPWRGQLLVALHALGDFTRELSEIRLARAELPGATQNTYYAQELRALAGLGRIEELRALVARLMSARPDSVPVAQLQIAGFELKRHGHKQEGEKLISDVTAFAVRHQAVLDSLLVATALAVDRRYDEGLRRLEKLAAGSNNYVRVGRFGVFAIYAGRTDIGDQMMARIAQMGDGAPSHLWRGLLTAARGDCQGAVGHFRTAIEKGQVFSAASFWHWDPSTEPIWGCEAFETLPPMQAPR